MIDQTANTPAYTSPYKFNGKELDDSTGMYYYGARYYDPRISVWMSVDPLAEKRSWVTPYNYCLNNPISRTDPDGMLDWKPNKDGNLTAEKGDNQITLSDFLGISFEKASEIYSNLANWDAGTSINLGIYNIENHTLTINDVGLKMGNIAEYYVGSNDWSLFAVNGDFGREDYKCNLFVYDVANYAGASPGLPNQAGFFGKILGHGPYPPTAGQWGNPNYNIPGWSVLKNGQTPIRGDVVSIPDQTINASGHMGIISTNGQTISATSFSVVKNNWGFRDRQRPVIRRWSGR